MSNQPPPVVIRDKRDIGSMTSIAFAGRQYKVTTPHGALFPQPSPSEAAVMVNTKHFAYMGHETDRIDPLKIDVKQGPPSLAELNERIAAQQARTGTITAPEGPLQRITAAGRRLSDNQIAAQRKQAHDIIKSTSSAGRPPQLGEAQTIAAELDLVTADTFEEEEAAFAAAAEDARAEQLAAAAAARKSTMLVIAPEDEAMAGLLASTAAVSGVDVTAVEVDGEGEGEDGEGSDSGAGGEDDDVLGLETMDLADLRSMAKEAKIRTWNTASRTELIKKLKD